jgi:hypothetical protein
MSERKVIVFGIGGLFLLYWLWKISVRSPLLAVLALVWCGSTWRCCREDPYARSVFPLSSPSLSSSVTLLNPAIRLPLIGCAVSFFPVLLWTMLGVPCGWWLSHDNVYHCRYWTADDSIGVLFMSTLIAIIIAPLISYGSPAAHTYRLKALFQSIPKLRIQALQNIHSKSFQPSAPSPTTVTPNVLNAPSISSSEGEGKLMELETGGDKVVVAASVDYAKVIGDMICPPYELAPIGVSFRDLAFDYQTVTYLINTAEALLASAESVSWSNLVNHKTEWSKIRDASSQYKKLLDPALRTLKSHNDFAKQRVPLSFVASTSTTKTSDEAADADQHITNNMIGVYHILSGIITLFDN